MFIKEITDMFTLRFNELALTDEETQAKIDSQYLVNKVGSTLRHHLGYRLTLTYQSRLPNYNTSLFHTHQLPNT